MKSKFKRIEGYWWNEDHTAYPMPEARSKPWKSQIDFLMALKAVEDRVAEAPIHDKGYSECRICQCRNGSGTFELEGKYYNWKWPTGLLHYVDAHNVKPSKDFRDFIFWAYKKYLV